MGWTAELDRTWAVKKRDGREVDFDPGRIATAIERAFAAEDAAMEIGSDVQEIVDSITESVQSNRASSYSVEQIQDAVEIGLMRRHHYRVARRYILYRTEHAKLRALRHQESLLAEANEADAMSGREGSSLLSLQIDADTRVPFDAERLRRFIRSVPESGAAEVDIDEIVDEVVRGAFDGMTPADVARALVLSARSRIERDPAYDRLAASLQLAIGYRQSIGASQFDRSFAELHRDQFEHYVIAGIRGGLLSEELRSFDLEVLANALLPERDSQFRYLGVQTLYDRYLLHLDGRRIESPQYLWMRVAMGLALGESESREQRAIEFYQLLSSFQFTSATPTLFNSGTPHPQLSSCYLTTVGDDLQQIFKSVGDNAMLSKWAGGLGNDWTSVRATGSLIKGTNGESQGVIPFLKVVNDAALAVNQGGKRKGAVCAYLEPWHLDFEEFIDLRKNTGDDRRRTHDMHTAAWIPDLFMQRVRDVEMWTLFSPDETPDLHETFGREFKDRYEHYESMADQGLLRNHRRLPALDLWRKMLTRLFETGHPWITFKDPSNVRSPQDHVGVVHSSNLCTEILLNTSDQETAVCNLGSINLGAHTVDGQLDLAKLETSVRTAMRMLDNVIDINYYPTIEARNSNLRHRPVGLGMMGFQDALHAIGVPIASEAAVEFADRSMEAISYFAILASSELAASRGKYDTYQDSKWDRGLLPLDTVELLEAERGESLDINQSSSLDWQVVRDSIDAHGMRNSNCLAIAPTATISTIVGVSQSIEPTYKHLYTKSNLSGEFTQINEKLVTALKELGLWDKSMLDALKYYDGSLAEIDRVPDDLKARFATAFEIEPRWLIAAASRRQKWIDQGQSLNLYIAKPSGKAIASMYEDAWKSGLKTTYYLRCLAATQVEKSTVDVNAHGIQPRWMKSRSESSEIRLDRADPHGEAVPRPAQSESAACSIEDPDCEACQ